MEGLQNASGEVVLQQITIAGVPVLKVRKGHQIVYKLANNIAVSALNPAQRHYITQEIMKLHSMDTVAGAANPSIVPQSRSLLPTRRMSTRLDNGNGYPMFFERRRKTHIASAEGAQVAAIRKSISTALHEDRAKVLQPNIKEPFISVDDAIERLLPYHLYTYPDEDFDAPEDYEVERKSSELMKRFDDIYKRTSEISRREAARTYDETDLYAEKLLNTEEQNLVAGLRKHYGQVTTHLATSQNPMLPFMVNPYHLMQAYAGLSSSQMPGLPMQNPTPLSNPKPAANNNNERSLVGETKTATINVDDDEGSDETSVNSDETDE